MAAAARDSAHAPKPEPTPASLRGSLDDICAPGPEPGLGGVLAAVAAGLSALLVRLLQPAVNGIVRPPAARRSSRLPLILVALARRAGSVGADAAGQQRGRRGGRRHPGSALWPAGAGGPRAVAGQPQRGLRLPGSVRHQPSERSRLERRHQSGATVAHPGGAFVVMAVMDWRLTLAVLLAAPLVAGALRLFLKRPRPRRAGRCAPPEISPSP